VADAVDGLTVWHLALPVRTARDHGSGLVKGDVEIVVVRLRSASGAAGFGEAAPWVVFTGSAEASAAALDRYLRPVVLGRDPDQLPAIMADAERALVGHPEAKAALETALLDLRGRLAGQPVWALLGGRCRTDIALSISLADPDFAADVDLLGRFRAQGGNIVKLKTGTRDHAFDLRRLERLRSDFAGLDIRVDYNQGMSGFEALRRLRDIERFAVSFIEQPVPASDHAAMARLTAALDTPILADETVFGPIDALRAAKHRLCDAISVKIMKSGGLCSGQTVAAIAQAAGMPAYGGDMFESGLAHLAGSHLIAATPNISLGCEFYQARWYLEQDILSAPFPCDGGKVRVPDGPGLGIDVDTPKLEFFAINRRGD